MSTGTFTITAAGTVPINGYASSSAAVPVAGPLGSVVPASPVVGTFPVPTFMANAFAQGGSHTELWLGLTGDATAKTFTVAFVDANSLAWKFSYANGVMTTVSGNSQQASISDYNVSQATFSTFRWQYAGTNGPAFVSGDAYLVTWTFVSNAVPTPTGHGDIMNPRAWQDVVSGILPPTEYDGIPGGGFV